MHLGYADSVRRYWLSKQQIPDVLPPGVDVLGVVVELDRDPVAIRRPVRGVHHLQPAGVTPRSVLPPDRPIRRTSRRYPDVDSGLEGLRKEPRVRCEGRDLIEASVEHMYSNLIG